MNYLSSSHKKFATAAIAAALVTTAAIPASAASFSDVSDRYEEAVKFLVEKQIAEGLSASSFGTSKSIKRVDTAIMLAKALELDTKKVSSSGFTDVPARAKSYVDALKAAKIVDGKTATSFAVNQELTRGEAALMLVKAYGLPAAKTKVTLTDVGSRYEAAVAALLENKITSGKTATTFGTQQPITRGEFAVFIHRLENLQKEAAPSSVTVKNETELKAAIASKSINKITLSENVAVKELPTITHYLQLDLNGKTLTADLKYEMAEEQKEISLVSSKADGKLQGNLTVNVPKADFVVGEGVEVAGSAVIINVKENTFHNKGTLNAVDIQDSDGTSFENHGQGAIKGDVSINTVGDVKLIGKVDSVEVNQAAKITVDAAATIAKLNVKVENVVLNAPKGSVGKVEASAGVVVKDSSGQAVVTTPTPVYTAPIVLNTTQLISKYEELQKEFIGGNFENEERYWYSDDLMTARELLAEKLKTKVITENEKLRLEQIDEKLDVYLVNSTNPRPHVFYDDNKVDLKKSNVGGVFISWKTSHPDVISAEGVLNKPSKGQNAVVVTLTAVITRNNSSIEKEYLVTIEPETNIYTNAKSLKPEERKEANKLYGFINSLIFINFDIEEIKKEYPGYNKAKISIYNNNGEEKNWTIDDLASEKSLIIKDAFKEEVNSTNSSVRVIIKLVNENKEENLEVPTFTHTIGVYNIYSYANDALRAEREELNVENIVNYIPEGKNFTLEERQAILREFESVSDDILDILGELQKIAKEVKLASTKN